MGRIRSLYRGKETMGADTWHGAVTKNATTVKVVLTMDLISRKEALQYLDKRRTYELMDGRNKAYGKGIRDAIKDIEAQPSVPAVPLDKLCEYLNSVIYPCIICKESPGPQCNAKREGCWERVLTKWMEEQDAAD